MFTYDITTDAGKVRLLVSDTNADLYDFEDDEIDAMLDLANGSVYMAAADLLESLAANRARLARSVKRGDMHEDLTKLASSIGDRVKSLRARAQDATQNESDTILESIATPNWRERGENSDDRGWWTYLCDSPL